MFIHYGNIKRSKLNIKLILNESLGWDIHIHSCWSRWNEKEMLLAPYFFQQVLAMKIEGRNEWSFRQCKVSPWHTRLSVKQWSARSTEIICGGEENHNNFFIHRFCKDLHSPGSVYYGVSTWRCSLVLSFNCEIQKSKTVFSLVSTYVMWEAICDAKAS